MSTEINPLLCRPVQYKNIVASKDITKTQPEIMMVQRSTHSKVTDKTNSFNEETANYNKDNDVQIVYDNKMLGPQYQSIHGPNPHIKDINYYRENNHQLNVVRRQQVRGRNGNEHLIEKLNECASVPTNMDHIKTTNEIPSNSQHEGYDFSIPFNESNILVKIMSSDEKNQSQVSNFSTASVKDKKRKTHIWDGLKKDRCEEPKTG